MESIERERSIESALDAWDRGFSVIQLSMPDMAVPNSGKSPVGKWKEAQKTRCLRLEAGSIEGNYGIVTGEVSGIVVVDVDSPSAMSWVREHLALPDSFTKTKNGWHLPYKHPGIRVPNGAKIRGLPLDIRGDGGYIVGAGSTHWTGFRYEAVGSWDVDSLPTFDPAWIAEKRKHTESSIEVGAVESRLRVVRRAIKYVKKIESAVSGQNGHNTMFRVVCKLLKDEPIGFGLTESEARPIIASYNARAVPPFSDKEVEHKMQSVLKQIHKTIGEPK